MEYLPVELLYQIIQQQNNVTDILNLCRTNRFIQRICQDDYFWHNLYQKSGFPINTVKSILSWKDNFLTAYRNRDVYDQLTDIKLNDILLYLNIIEIQKWFNTHNYFIDDHNKRRKDEPPFISITRRFTSFHDNTVYRDGHGWIGPYMNNLYEDSRKSTFKIEKDNQLHMLEGGNGMWDRDYMLLPSNRVVTEFYYRTTSILLTLEEFLKIDLHQINYRSTITIDDEIRSQVSLLVSSYNKYLSKIDTAIIGEGTFDQMSIITKITRLRLILFDTIIN